MKASKSSIILLIVLLVVLAGVAYYLLFYKPGAAAIDEMKITLEQKQLEVDAMRAKIASEKALDKRIVEKIETVLELSERVFVDLEQEEALEISSGELNDNRKIIFDNIAFNEFLNEEARKRTIEQTLMFQTDYHTLMEYLRNLRRYDKNIACRNIRLQHSRQLKNNVVVESLETNMALAYVAMPDLEMIGMVDEKLIRDALSTRDLSKGPFARYKGYVDPADIKPSAPTPAPSLPAPSYPAPGPGTAPQQPHEKPRRMVYDFEAESSFFVGSDGMVAGSVLRSKSRKSGSFSADLAFDFVTAKEYNAASLVFDRNQVMLQSQPAALYIQIYSYETSNHNIAMHILDSSGRDYYVTLANGVDWTEWKEVTVDLPSGITYPCVVQRIYVEGIGYEQKLKGRYLFDRLQVEQP